MLLLLIFSLICRLFLERNNVLNVVFESMILALLGIDLVTASGATATCLGNIGPGIGTVGNVNNFAHLPELVKWILSLFMVIDRLELFTVLIIFSPAFWKS
jgi:trk system potassium uptake protein TrkH